MPEQKEQDLAARNIPGMMNRGRRFAQAEHAENAGAALRRIASYFARESSAVLAMLAAVISGTACGVYAPSLQSNAIDIIAGVREGSLMGTVLWMLGAYLLYSVCQLLQGLLSARLSQRIVRRMRAELFGKLVDLPIRYMDTHSHGDVMSRMTNDRLSTIRDADLIVVMDRGRIVECGDHEALLARRGRYYELYMTQYAGFAT